MTPKGDKVDKEGKEGKGGYNIFSDIKSNAQRHTYIHFDTCMFVPRRTASKANDVSVAKNAEPWAGRAGPNQVIGQSAPLSDCCSDQFAALC